MDFRPFQVDENAYSFDFATPQAVNTGILADKKRCTPRVGRRIGDLRVLMLV